MIQRGDILHGTKFYKPIRVVAEPHMLSDIDD